MTAFMHEEEIEAAYEVAEMVLTNRIVVMGGKLRITDDVRNVARAVADAIIRTQTFESGDITDLKEVKAERVNPRAD